MAAQFVLEYSTGRLLGCNCLTACVEDRACADKPDFPEVPKLDFREVRSSVSVAWI